MTIEHVDKVPLDLNEYATYNIPQSYMAYEIKFQNITQDKCDDLESEYSVKGYKIFHADLQRSVSNLFDYTLIIAKCEMIF
jgi:hypothetical protein